MFCVAICDDEKAICTEIECFLKSYIERGIVQTAVYHSGENLYEAILSGEYFDLIFLDIELKLLNGVTVGKKIREELCNEKIHIVFISGKSEYAMELFAMRPLHFLVKPFTEKQVTDVLEKAMSLSEIYCGFYEFQIEQSFYKIPYGDILYFESKARKIVLHTLHMDYEFYEKLSHIEENTHKYFLRIHQSYLINPIYIERYEHDQVTLLDHQILSISKGFRKTVRSQILKNWGKI